MMNGSAKIQPKHLNRQAVVYLRQSSNKQVMQNQESAANQRALRERLLELGWRKEQVRIIDDDQGQSAKHADGRLGFQNLVADVGLGRIGMVMGYEVSRLSRNCADWHRLLELCAMFDTLIGDSDGIYHPYDFNDRLLLGLKGTMSAAELHSLRLRLDAGRMSKAKRGELVQHLPTGLIRDFDGNVTLDPDESIQQRIRLLFEKLAELGTIHQVLAYLERNKLKIPRKQTSGLYAGQVLWKDASAHSLNSVFKNPAYAGAFAYGRRIGDATRQVAGRPATGRIRQPREKWLALIHDVYPAYITWKQFEANQELIAANGQRMKLRLASSQANRAKLALLAGLVRCGKCGSKMQVSYKDGRYQYACATGYRHYGKRSCQYLSGQSIDDAVVSEFFTALSPANIDALEELSRQQVAKHHQLIDQQQKDVERQEYAANRAYQQYDSVDPKNRLIAASLENKWESALGHLEQAQQNLERTRRDKPTAVTVPLSLREAFTDVGRQLPTIWSQVDDASRRELLRTLIAQVNIRRDSNGVAHLRIVWHGSMVSEAEVRLRVFTLRDSDIEQAVVERIRELLGEGKAISSVAAVLNAEGRRPSRSEMFTEAIVRKLCRRKGMKSMWHSSRIGDHPSAYTVNQICNLLSVPTHWIHNRIRTGTIEAVKNERLHCYLFPKSQEIIDSLQALKNGEVNNVKVPEVHLDG